MNPADNHTPYWPRGLRRVLAAKYIGVSLSLWDELVLSGEMPKPKRVHGRTIWDKIAIDRAFDVWGGGLPLDQYGEEVYEFKA
jgi:hypothetical protein